MFFGKNNLWTWRKEALPSIKYRDMCNWWNCKCISTVWLAWLWYHCYCVKNFNTTIILCICCYLLYRFCSSIIHYSELYLFIPFVKKFISLSCHIIFICLLCKLRINCDAMYFVSMWKVFLSLQFATIDYLLDLRS